MPLVGVLVLVIGAVVVLNWGGGDAVPLPPGGGGPADQARGGSGDGNPQQPVDNGPRRVQLPDGVVAKNTEEVEIEAEGLADKATACLKVVDYRTKKPVASAIVRALQNGADIGFTDERGLASVPLAQPAQLAVVVEGYLLRLAPVQLGSTEESPQMVQLVPDQWSLRRSFAFVDPDGNAVTDVLVRLRPKAKGQPTLAPVPREDAVLQRAWSEHTMLATREVSRDVAVQLGTFDTERVHLLSGRTPAIRFVAPGDYVMEAATTTGLVASLTVAVIPGSEPAAQRVAMHAGAWISGKVTNLAAAPLQEATVTVQGSEPLGLEATTGSDGSFAIGPLVNGQKKLLVRHGLHEPVAFGPVQAPTKDVLIKLRPLARTPLKGRVRARPGNEPIAGATVVWRVPNGAAISAKTAEDGTFMLHAAGEVAARLIVQAAGYEAYAELVDPNAPFADYDIWPAKTAVRLAAGITATLEGVVLGRDGKPQPNVSVRWSPRARTALPGVPGRRILEGATLHLPGVATTDSSGAFVIETHQFGGGTVSLVDDSTKKVEATAVAGQTENGLELQR